MVLDDQFLKELFKFVFQSGFWGPFQGEDFQCLNEATLSVCQELKITCIDVGADIEWEPIDFDDSLHAMPSGSAKLAEFLFAELKDILK